MKNGRKENGDDGERRGDRSRRGNMAMLDDRTIRDVNTK